ncbi:hypothetical protein VPH35_034628 [Triticum aestivum]
MLFVFFRSSLDVQLQAHLHSNCFSQYSTPGVHCFTHQNLPHHSTVIQSMTAWLCITVQYNTFISLFFMSADVQEIHVLLEQHHLILALAGPAQQQRYGSSSSCSAAKRRQQRY